MSQDKRTKIVCTIGPASSDPAVMEKMVEAGMNVARLNFSHGTHEDHTKLIETVRGLSEKMGRPIAILQDLQGPKVRTGDLPDEGVELVAGSEVIFSTADDAKLPKVPVGYKKLHEDVKEGDKLLLDDGLLDVLVKKVDGQDITCEVVTGGMLKSHKGINLPTSSLSIPAITKKDREDLEFGVGQHVDWVALSFVRSADDVKELRDLITGHEKALGKKHEQEPQIKIIAKIEKHEAIANIDEIIEAVDGIMVARGDLGIETPAEDVPLHQKMLIEKCMAAAKPVVVATQMLDSMIRNPRPTRAEVSDVANAVIDHTDATMLSGESATGDYPVETVGTMARVIRETESSSRDDLEMKDSAPPPHPTGDAIAEAVAMLARHTDVKLILVASISGDTARKVSRHRPELPIVVATTSERTRNQLAVSWGVEPFVMKECKTIEKLIDKGIAHLKGEKMVKVGDRIAIVAGLPLGESGGANMVEIKEIG